MSLIIRLKFFLISIWNNITIEPVVLLYLTSVGLTSVIRPNLIIDKACRIKLNLTEEICGNLTDISDSGNANVIEVQKVVAEYESTLNLVATLPRVTFTLLAGPWSDRHGRKLLILVPIFGQAITALTYILNVKYFNQLPFEALYMELINELSGNFVVYYLGIYSYMADITSFDVRTSRLGILDGTDYISTMLGTYISGPVFENLGYFAVFSASLVLAVCGVLYVWILVAESKSKIKSNTEEQQTMYGTEETFVKGATNSVCCQWSDIVACVKTVFKERPDNRRLMVWLLLFNFASYIFAYNGTEGTHRYLFARKQYGWDEQQYTGFLAAYKFCYLISLWALLPLCSKILRLHDATTLIIVCITGAVGWSLPAFIGGQMTFILGFVLASLTPVATVATRALISKCVAEDEVGSIFALVSLISAVSSSLITAAYQAIYSATLDTFAATFLVINASLLILTIPNNVYLRQRLR